MKVVEKLRRGIQHPGTILRKARIIAVRPFTGPTGDETAFLERDWDTLVILDGCRYDLFADRNPFDSSVEKVHSNASHTREYIERNYVGKDCLDTVYVTASPQFANYDLSFAEVEHVWRDHWDEEYRTVLPPSVTDAALEILREYQDKRVVVHYMQPHYPFIGETGRQISEQATFVPNPERLSIWEQLATGAVSETQVREAYAENLDTVLPEVQRLVEYIDGKTVITSDHGNLFGQRVCWLPVRIHGHPAEIHHPELTAVPWVELPFESRREVRRADESAVGERSFENVEKHLADLGYLS